MVCVSALPAPGEEGCEAWRIGTVKEGEVTGEGGRLGIPLGDRFLLNHF